jgi:hypothetical protein
MPRVVPNQVVAFIDSAFPSTEEIVHLSRLDTGQISGLIDLVDQIPGELLMMDNTMYALLVSSKATIRELLTGFIADRQAGRAKAPFSIAGSQSPLRIIRDALAKCPDESPAPGTSELNFITDADLRAELRIDIGQINRALANGEWKAATVLAGSAVEALLLWALQQRTPAEIASVLAALGMKRDPNQMEAREWDLHGYIEVAERLAVITRDTATAARLAKDFGNLIHPGRALRLAQTCDRATALSAVAAMEHVVRDLIP